MTPTADRSGRQILLSLILGLFVLFGAELVMGAFLAISYHATPALAYADISRMGLFRAFHYWGSAASIFGGMCAVVAMLRAGWFSGGRVRIWYATLLMLACAMGFQITGNALPFDRHGVQTAVVEAGVARATPVVGGAVAQAMLAGPQFNDGTIARWYAVHLGLTLLALIALGLFWTGIRGERTGRPWAWLPVGLVGLLAFTIPAPLGTRAGLADYGAFDAQVSWYTWPLHGAFNFFSSLGPGLGWIGSALLPGLFAALLLAAPWLARRVSARSIQLTVGGFLILAMFAGVFYGGRFAPLIGDRDPPSTVVRTRDASPVNQALYATGRKLFNSEGCANCHGVDGRQPTIGPNLLGVAERRGSDPAWYEGFIRHPQATKPNTMMPASPNLTDAQVRAIAEFLIYQK